MATAAPKGKKLNPEQLQAVKYGKGPLLIIAGAGTGKTTVITERIKHLILERDVKPSEILALTFTEKASREMEERIDRALPYGYTQMWVVTFHSFCDRILRREALHIGLDPKYKLATEAETIQFVRKHLFKFDLNYFRPLGNPTRFVGAMLSHFSRLQDEDITPSEYIAWGNAKNKEQSIKTSKEEKIELEKWLELAKAYETYEELKTKAAMLDFANLISKTLKLFRERPNVLKEYQDQFKYVLVDEFQDTNYAQNQLAMLLAGNRKNITVCGDDDQCLPPNAEIYTSIGTKKIKDIKISDQVITAIGKGHTSLSTVTGVFKRKKKAIFLTFVLEDGKKIEVTDNHKMFCFLPAHYDLKGWHFVYLMTQAGLGYRIGVTNNIPQRLRLERYADKIFVLGSFPTSQEARYYESYLAAKYGLPTVPFTPRPGQSISGEWLIKLFTEIDTKKNAQKLALDFHLDLDSPVFAIDAVTRGVSKRVKVNFEMCSRNYKSKTRKNGFVGNPGVLHSVYLDTSNTAIINLLKEKGYILQKAKKGKRFRFTSTSITDAWKEAEKISQITGSIIDKKFKLGRYNYQHLSSRIVPASHVFPGMYLPVLNGGQVDYRLVVSRTQEEKTIETYDLEIDRTHNFIADGIVVHNSIYRFRGAAISNILQFRRTYPKAKAVVLTKNYRSAQEILDKSYALVQNNNPDRLEVAEKIDKKLIAQRKSGGEVNFIHKGRVENEAEAVGKVIKRLSDEVKYKFSDFAILVRANNHAEPFIKALQRQAIPYQFLGPGRLFRQPEIIELISFLKVLYDFDDSTSLYRLLSMDSFGISVKDLIKITNQGRYSHATLFEVCEKIDEVFVSFETKEKVKSIISVVNRQIEKINKETAGQLLYGFLVETGLLVKLFNPDTPEAEKRATNISKFFDKLKTYESEHEEAGVVAVTDWIDLCSELGESPLAADSDWSEVNAVNILTAHSAKGLEFPVVFLVNLVSQRFPTNERHETLPIPEELIKEVLPQGDYHLQEERRLFYVGMTRAKDILYLTAADYYGEAKREKKLSPFIFEVLGDEVLASEQEEASGEQLSFMDYQNSTPTVEADTDKLKLPPVHVDYLSYSQIENFRTCPLHYRLSYILGIKTPKTSALSFGDCVHKALRDFYQSIKDGEKGTLELLLNSLDNNWTHDGYMDKVHEEKMHEQGKNYLTGFFETQFNVKVVPAALEQRFNLPLSGLNGGRGVRLGGMIDRVDVLPDGKIEIIDYKTGANIPTQKEVDGNLQLTFYALAAAKMPEAPFNRKPEEIVLSLYYFDEQVKITTARTKAQLDGAITEIFKWRDEIEKSDFKCSHGYFCENGCEYSIFCGADS